MAPPNKAIPSSVNGTHAGWPKQTAFRADSQTEALISKLVERQAASYGNSVRRDRKVYQPDPKYVNDLVATTAGSIADSQNMMQMCPDIGLAAEILISTILAPQDMTSCEINFHAAGDLWGEALVPLLDIVRDYFLNHYKIKRMLPEILRKVLFETGSYPLAVIPESSIDDAINSDCRISTEALAYEFHDRRPVHYGILGNENVQFGKTGATTSLEGYAVDSRQGVPGFFSGVGRAEFLLTVTDNPNVLKLPLVKARQVADHIEDAYARHRMGTRVSNEARQGATNSSESLYRRRQYAMTPVQRMQPQSQLERASVGHPMVMALPSECVIPVHAPGIPDEHVGYYVALDPSGNPIKSSLTEDYYSDIKRNASKYGNQASALLSAARRESEGLQDINAQTIEESQRIYAETLEEKLNERLINGIHGDSAVIANSAEVFRVMFARAMAQKHTQLLFIPSSLMTYVAFDYNDNGIGRSLLEATKIIGAMRSMLMLSNTMAAVKNSVAHKVIGVKLDEADPNPEKSVEMIQDSYAKSRFAEFPIGISNPTDLVNYLANAGTQFKINGHPAYPETEISVDDLGSSNVRVDTDLLDSYRKQQYMGIGVPPEVVDTSGNVDFATQVVTSNILFAKRAMVHQEKLVHHMSDHIQKVSFNSQVIMDRLIKCMTENKDKLRTEQVPEGTSIDKLVLHFINGLSITLPTPDLSKLEEQEIAFDKYCEFLDKALPSLISTEMFDSNLEGTLNDAVASAIAGLKAYYQRQWLQKNNALPELFELITHTDQDGATIDLLDIAESHLESLNMSLMPFMKRQLEAAAKRNKVLNPLKEEAGGSGGFGGDSGGGDTGGGDDFSGGDDGGFGGEGDDFNADLDENATDAETDANGSGDQAPDIEEEPKPEDEKDDAANPAAKPALTTVGGQ